MTLCLHRDETQKPTRCRPSEYQKSHGGSQKKTHHRSSAEAHAHRFGQTSREGCEEPAAAQLTRDY